MMKAETNDGNAADDERKAWMDSKKAVKLAKNANDKMDNIREASVAKAKANEDAAMQKAIAKTAKMQKVKAKDDANMQVAKAEAEQKEEQDHAARMRAVDKMIMEAKKRMEAKKEVFMQTPLANDQDAVKLMTDTQEALVAWEQHVKPIVASLDDRMSTDDRITHDEKDTYIESTYGDNQPSVRHSSASAYVQTTLTPFMKPGMHPELVPSREDVTDGQKIDVEMERIKKEMEMERAMIAKTREMKKKTAERTSARLCPDNLASEAKKITEDQEPNTCITQRHAKMYHMFHNMCVNSDTQYHDPKFGIIPACQTLQHPSCNLYLVGLWIHKEKDKGVAEAELQRTHNKKGRPLGMAWNQIHSRIGKIHRTYSV
jgi:hypothetical protein